MTNKNNKKITSFSELVQLIDAKWSKTYEKFEETPEDPKAERIKTGDEPFEFDSE